MLNLTEGRQTPTQNLLEYSASPETTFKLQSTGIYS